MLRQNTHVAEAVFELPTHRPSVLTQWLRHARRKPLAAAGALILTVLILMAIFASLLAPADPFEFNTSIRLTEPTRANLFGTDEFGRDLFTRILYGARVSLRVGLLTVLVAATAGTTIGIVSGYFGGWVDSIIQRFVDIFMAMPGIVLALAIVAVRGQGATNVIIALAVVTTPNFARVVRSTILSLKERTFIEASRTVGAAPIRIMFRHLLPNSAASIIILATSGMGGAILAEASLSFLGLGTPPPEPSWGGMLSNSARRFAFTAPWLVIFPGIALSAAIFAFNLLGDGLRDILDPRQRGTR